jgi:hypothetical protein
MTFPIDLLIHVANVLYLVAYMVRDVLWLRILTVVGAFCLMPFYYFRAQPIQAGNRRNGTRSNIAGPRVFAVSASTV